MLLKEMTHGGLWTLLGPPIGRQISKPGPENENLLLPQPPPPPVARAPVAKDARAANSEREDEPTMIGELNLRDDESQRACGWKDRGGRDKNGRHQVATNGAFIRHRTWHEKRTSGRLRLYRGGGVFAV